MNKTYEVESRNYNNEAYDNLTYDYIEAESFEEAVDFYKDWVDENGGNTDEIDAYRVREVITNELGGCEFGNWEFF